MAEHPLVSVCIPSYNGEDFIACTIQSVLAQTFRNYELVVVDDSSQDATVRIIQSFSDPRIKVIQNDRNLGLAANWNKVLSCATGKYVKLMGGDDVLHPDCLRRQVEILDNSSNSEVALAICNRNVIASDNDIVMRRGFPIGPGRVNGKSLIRTSIRRGSNLIGEPVAGLFRMEALPRTAACDASNPYLVDLALWAELLKNGDAVIDPEYLVSFRISGKTASANIGRRQAAYFRSFVRTIRTEKSHDVSWLDAALGCALSYPWCLARNCFMKFYFRKTRPGKTNQQPCIPQREGKNTHASCQATA